LSIAAGDIVVGDAHAKTTLLADNLIIDKFIGGSGTVNIIL